VELKRRLSLMCIRHYINISFLILYKGKAMPLQAWTGPEGSRMLSRRSTHEDGKVVSPTHRPPLPPGNIPVTFF